MGTDFPMRLLKLLTIRRIEINDGEKVGIINIKKTLFLLYKQNNLLKISNCEPSGARVEILIPQWEEERNALPSGG